MPKLTVDAQTGSQQPSEDRDHRQEAEPAKLEVALDEPGLVPLASDGREVAVSAERVTSGVRVDAGTEPGPTHRGRAPRSVNDDVDELRARGLPEVARDR